MLLLTSITFSGCTSQDTFIHNPEPMNLSDEKRQQFIEGNRDLPDRGEKRMLNNTTERPPFAEQQPESSDGKKEGDYPSRPVDLPT
jgi:hypothetical protein